MCDMAINSITNGEISGVTRKPIIFRFIMYPSLSADNKCNTGIIERSSTRRIGSYEFIGPVNSSVKRHG